MNVACYSQIGNCERMPHGHRNLSTERTCCTQTFDNASHEAAIAPLFVCENNGGLDLPLGNTPVFSEKSFFLLCADDSKAVVLIKSDRPQRIRPCADQHGPMCHRSQISEHLGSDPLFLSLGPDVCVADECDV